MHHRRRGRRLAQLVDSGGLESSEAHRGLRRRFLEAPQGGADIRRDVRAPAHGRRLLRLVGLLASAADLWRHCGTLAQPGGGGTRDRSENEIVVDDRQAIFDAVKRYFDQDAPATSVAGKLRSLADSMDAHFPFVPKEKIKLSINKLELVYAEDDLAVVDLDAVLRWESIVDAPRNYLTQYTGPVEVVREDGKWRVADLIQNGTSVREAIFDPAVADVHDGLELVSLAGRRERRFVRVYFESRSTLGAPLAITGAAFGYRTKLRRWRWGRALLPLQEIPRGVYRFAVDGQAEDVKRGAEVRVVLRTATGLLDARPASVRRRRRFPRTTGRRWSLWLPLIGLALLLPLLRAPWWLLPIFLLWIGVMYQRYWRRSD